MTDGVEREATVKIVNRAGLHARPAALLVRTAGAFDSMVYVEKDGLQVNCKSIMGVLMLAAEQGSTLRFTATGEDAEDALRALTELVDGGFEEE